jgi:hypothetical protein
LQVKADIGGAVLKLSRVYLQLEALNREVCALFPGTETPLRMEAVRDGLEYLFFVDDVAPILEHWALVASEILFNIRSALDYLAFELHVRHFSGRVPPAVAKDPQFPIFSTVTDLCRHRSTRRLSKRDQSALQQFQPFVRRSDGFKYVRMQLEQMNATHVADKHRALQVVAAAIGAYGSPSFPDWCGFENHIPPDPIVSNACVQRWAFERKPVGLQLDHTAIISVAVVTPDSRFNLINTFGQFANAATFVLERFSDRFEKVPRPVAWRHPMWTDPLLPEGAVSPKRRSLF